MCGIERTLKLGANMPHSKYPKDEVEELKLQIQKILDVLNTPCTSLNDNLGEDERAPHLVPVSRCGATTMTVSGSGASLTPPLLYCTEC